MLHCLPADVPQLMSNLSDCFADVSGWCASRRLQLNGNKTESLLFGTACSLKKIPLGSDVMQAGPSVIKSAAVVVTTGRTNRTARNLDRRYLTANCSLTFSNIL